MCFSVWDATNLHVKPKGPTPTFLPRFCLSEWPGLIKGCPVTWWWIWVGWTWWKTRIHRLWSNDSCVLPHERRPWPKCERCAAQRFLFFGVWWNGRKQHKNCGLTKKITVENSLRPEWPRLVKVLGDCSQLYESNHNNLDTWIFQVCRILCLFTQNN